MAEEFATQDNALAVDTGSAPVETPVADTPAVTEPTSAPVELTTPSIEPPQDGSAPENEESKAVRELKAQRKRRQEAEKRVAYLEGLVEGRGPAAPKAPEPAEPKLTEPKIDDFTTYEEFERANRQYMVGLATQEAKKQLMAEFRKNQEAQITESRQVEFRERINAAAQTDPTIVDLIADKTLPVSAAMAEVIQGSEAAPELLKWIDNNRLEAQRIARLTPVLAARELGRIEAHMMLAPKPEPPKRISQAPTPIPTVTSAGASTVEEDQLPMDQWVARERERVKARGRRY